MPRRLPLRLTLVAGLLSAAAALFAEPALRPGQSATADQWLLYLGNEYDRCEGCCTANSLCCTINAKCSYKVPT